MPVRYQAAPRPVNERTMELGTSLNSALNLTNSRRRGKLPLGESGPRSPRSFREPLLDLPQSIPEAAQTFFALGIGEGNLRLFYEVLLLR